MSIKYAILGLLSWKPSTGYELKKIFEESSFMHWSGNNNQIYKPLLQLHEEGFVSSEVRHQDNSPSKKIYSITEEGLHELKKWVLSAPEAPEFKNTFLIQLAWAHQLDNEQLMALLEGYESEVRVQLLLQSEKKHRGLNSPNRNLREAFVWNKIYDNSILFYNHELDWIQEMKNELMNLNNEEG